MAGRHSINAKASLNTLSLTQTRAAIAATAFGAMFSMALPATASTEASGAEALAALSVEKDAAQNQDKVADSTQSFTAGDGDATGGSASFDLEVDQDTSNSDIIVDVPQDPTPVEAEPAQQPVQEAAPAATPAAPAQQQAAPAATPAAPAQQQAAPAAADPAPAPASSVGQMAVAIGRQFIGVPYVYGGASPAGFDCSGFVSYVYAQLGYSLPHSSSALRYAGVVVPASQAQPGDVMWWPGHVALFTGHSQLEAVGYGSGVRENPIRSGAVYIRIAR